MSPKCKTSKICVVNNKLLSFTFLLFSSSVFSQITGSNKIQFENEYVTSCNDIQRRNEWNKKFSNKEIRDYCVCMSNHITDRATVSDVNATTDRFKRIIDDAGVLCTARYFMNR